MHISELARTAGVNVQTIRFYERESLMPTPLRSQAGYRCYSARDVERVMFIRRNQELGFTLAEIKQLHELHDILATIPHPLKRKPTEIQQIIAIGRERLNHINEKIRMLNLVKKQLTSVISHLEGEDMPMTCPVNPKGALPSAALPKNPRKMS